MIKALGISPNIAIAVKDTYPHPRYHFHGYAGDQLLGDGKVFDKSGLSHHAARGANLSDAQLFANAGYVSTVAPAGGATDSVLRMANLNFDYVGGEKLIGWWLGKMTAPASSMSWMGDGYTTTYPGLRFIISATGKVQVVAYQSGGSSFSSASASTLADGTLHSYGFVIDGAAKKACMWIDEVVDANFGGYATVWGGGSYDTRNSNTYNIGHSAPNAAAESTNGIVTQTRAFHLLRLSASDAVPTSSTVTNLFGSLRANPSKPILGSAF